MILSRGQQWPNLTNHRLVQQANVRRYLKTMDDWTITTGSTAGSPGNFVLKGGGGWWGCEGGGGGCKAHFTGTRGKESGRWGRGPRAPPPPPPPPPPPLPAFFFFWYRRTLSLPSEWLLIRSLVPALPP